MISPDGIVICRTSSNNPMFYLPTQINKYRCSGEYFGVYPVELHPGDCGWGWCQGARTRTRGRYKTCARGSHGHGRWRKGLYWVEMNWWGNQWNPFSQWNGSWSFSVRACNFSMYLTSDDRPTDKPTDRPTDRPTNKLTDRPTG